MPFKRAAKTDRIFHSEVIKWFILIVANDIFQRNYVTSWQKTPTDQQTACFKSLCE